MDKPIAKNKGGRPRKPPTPPVLGVALRQGQGYMVNVILGGLVVNGKKWEPQAAAELLADMLEDGMKRLAPPAVVSVQLPSPETAVEDLPAAALAESGDARAAPELAMAPGEDTSTDTSKDTSNGNH